MSRYRSPWAILALLGLLLFPSVNPVGAKPRRNAVSAPAPAAAPATKPVDPYAAAQKDLTEDWYVLYRIVDRIARANGLDERPWRLVISPEYEINAFATDVNLVTIYNGILDQIGADSSAIACVVGHEMGHHVNRHIAIGEAEKAALTASIRQEAETQAKKEIESAQNDATGSAVGFGLLSIAGSFFGANTASFGQMAADAQKQRYEAAQKRIEQIAAQKQLELDQKLAANVRKQEFEADELGYRYIAKAGFDPKGCLRAMEVLARTPGAEFDTDHPAVPKRIERLKVLMVEYPASTLVDQGKLNLDTHRTALTYELSKDGKSLRINSFKGGSAASDIERQFGK